MALLNEDCFLQLASWCESIPDVVHIWIGLCLAKRGMSADSGFWRLFLKEYYKRYGGGVDLAGSIIRAGLRLDEQDGLQLLKKLYMRRKCSRSGCMIIFREIENFWGQCHFHPGGLRNGWSLTCCRGLSFQSALGCKVGFHDGSLHESIYSIRCERQILPPISKGGPPPNVTRTELSDQLMIKLPKI